MSRHKHQNRGGDKMKQTKKQVKQKQVKAPKPKTPKKSKTKEEELEFDDEFDFDSFDDIEERKPTATEMQILMSPYRKHIQSDKLIKAIRFPIKRFDGELRAEIEMANVSVDEVLSVKLALKCGLY